MVAEVQRGYSNVVQFSNPSGGSSSEYQGVGFQIEDIANQSLTPVIAVRNVGTATATVTAKVPYTRTDGTKGSITLPIEQLSGGEMRLLKVQRIIQRVQQENIKVASLEITYDTAPGSVIVAAHSVSDDHNQVFRVPLWDPLGQRSPTGGYPWHIEGTSATETYIKNIADYEEDYVAFLVWENGGIYMIGLKPLVAHETVQIDVKKLRDEQIPDERGRTIPLYISSGQLQWTLRRKDNLPDNDERANLALIGRSEQVDLTKKIVNSYACQNCCAGNFVSGYATPYPGDAEFGQNVQYAAYEVGQTCYGFPYSMQIPSPTWSSSSQNIAVINTNGLATTVGVGQTNITARWNTTRFRENQACPPGQVLWENGAEPDQCNNKETKETKGETPSNLAACGTCVAFGATVYGVSPLTVRPKIRILRDGTDITNIPQNVVVGQQIKLSATVVGGASSNIQWTIPETRIADYKLTCSTSTRCESGQVTPLTNLNNQDVDFYWVDGANGRQVTVTINVGGQQYSKSATFDVSKPTVNLSRTLGQVGVRLESNNYWYLRFGSDIFSGIDFVASGFSGPPGNKAFVQTTNPLRRVQLKTGNWCRWGAEGLDSRFPYILGSNTAEDSPGSLLNDGDLRATASDAFKMYYMYKPTGVSGLTIWVPLKVINWNWSGEALPINATDWRLNTSPNDRDATQAVDTIEFPQWTRIIVAGELQWMPEGSGYQCPN